MKYIDREQIPKSEGNVIAAMLLSTISDYFADPKHQQEFEEWQRSRKDARNRHMLDKHVGKETRDAAGG